MKWEQYYERLRHQQWNYLIDEPLSGAENMERDSALLRSVTAPTLRLYAWSRPTVSLGYSQRDDWVDYALCQRLGVEVVRRPTGGRALLHLPSEITYAVILPDASAQPGTTGPTLSVREAFRGIASLLGQALQHLGVAVDTAKEQQVPSSSVHPSCLEVTAPGEITARGRKLVGSAQCRVGVRLLQHGALPRINDAALLAAVIPGAKPQIDLQELGFAQLSRQELQRAWQEILQAQ